MEITLTALNTAGACESWETRGHVAVHTNHPGAITDLQPAGAGPVQMDRLLEILMASAGAAPEDRRRKCL